MTKKKDRRTPWQVEHDGEDYYVAWRTGCDNDESMSVYLPKDPKQRERAAYVIARALNRARIRMPR